MEPVEVIVRFDQQGKAFPQSFRWQDSTYQIESTGRRWQSDEGQHMLVMTPGSQVFELLFTRADSRWYLKQIKPARRSI